jgi:hypothetical protein
MIGIFGGDGGKLGLPLVIVRLKTQRKGMRKTSERSGMKGILCISCHDCCAISSLKVLTTRCVKLNNPNALQISLPNSY